MNDHTLSEAGHLLPDVLKQLHYTGVMAIAYSRFNGDIIDANPAFLKLFGYTLPEAEAGMLNWQKMTPGEFTPTAKAINDLKSNGDSPVLIKEYLHKDGHRIAVLITSTVIDHPQADVVNCLFDVTDQEVLKDQLKLVAARYRSIWNNNIVGINTWHTDGRVLDANEAYSRILGYSREEIVKGKVKWIAHLEPGNTKYLEGITDAQQGRPVIPYETRHRHRDGSYRTIITGYEMLPGSSTEGINILIDITEHKKLQGELNKTHERIRQVTELMVDILTIHDRDFKYTFVSPALEKLTGRSRKEFIGKTTWEMGFDSSLCMFFDESLSSVLKAKKSLTVEYQNGGRYLQSIMTPEFDENREVEHILIVTRDITALKEQEQKKDDFISLVGHELKTPVTSLKGMIQLTERHLRNNEVDQALQRLQKAEILLEKQAKMINNLMEASRLETHKLKLVYSTVPMIDLIADCIDLVSVHHDPELIDLDCDGDILVQADRDRLEQVFCNLLSNASRYSSPGSRIYVKVTLADKCVLISITDQGIGIDPQKLPYIFERFYRVNEQSRHSAGLGLGLFISAQIVSLHHGRIWAESEPGKGTTFFVEIPEAS